jgi:hypothetical protein
VRTTRATVRPHAKRGATTIVFGLTRPAVVRFTVVRVSPTCERVGVFHVRAHAGVNKVRFRGRLHGRPLSEGTYRLLVGARGARVDAAVLRIVVVEGPPLGPAELRAARKANVCGTTSTADGEGAETARGTFAPPSTAMPKDPPSSRDRAEAPIFGATGQAGRQAKSLGEHFAKAVQDPPSVHPLVWAALALSFLLLTVAVVPPAAFESARAEALAYRRFEIALAGTAALGTAFVLYLIS